MKRTASSLKWLVLILILALALSACERPVPGSENGGQNDAGSPAEPPVLTIPTTSPEEVPPQLEPYPAPGDTGSEGVPAEPPTGEETPAEPAPGGDETAPPDDTAAPESPTEPAIGDDSTPATTGERIHIVQSGENLYRIGLLYGFTWQELQTYNGLVNPNALEVGQEIKIPPSN